MPTMCKPIAVLVSDLHLSLQQPACRADADWKQVQASYLKQLCTLAATFKIPVICAGDIFDKWNAPPELVNFALEHLPDGMISIPGQHDLPNHRLDLMHKSGYGVLARSGKIIDLHKKKRHIGTGFTAHGFPWGVDPVPLSDRPCRHHVEIAVIHQYIWIPGCSYKDAPAKNRLKHFLPLVKGYDAVLVGDNHMGWNKGAVWNNGAFLRRKLDEIPYRPRVGVLHSDNTIHPHFLNTSNDVFHSKVEKRDTAPFNAAAFMDQLEKLGDEGIDFRSIVKQHLSTARISPESKQLILKSLEA
jgi:hypothetical protein